MIMQRLTNQGEPINMIRSIDYFDKNESLLVYVGPRYSLY